MEERFLHRLCFFIPRAPVFALTYSLLSIPIQHIIPSTNALVRRFAMKVCSSSPSSRCRSRTPAVPPLELDRVTKLVHGGGFALDLETRIHRTFGTGGIDELVCAGIADRLTAE